MIHQTIAFIENILIQEKNNAPVNIDNHNIANFKVQKSVIDSLVQPLWPNGKASDS